MTVELSSLKFNVDTAKLLEAKQRLDDLVAAQNRLAGVMSKPVGGGNAGASSGAGAIVKNSGKTVDALSKVDNALQRQSLKMSVLRGDAIALSDGLVQLERGFTSGQAGMLASLKLAGATSDQYKELASSFSDYNRITGANKFDDSVNGLTKLRKEVTELTTIQKLQAEGYKLSAKEIRDLTRDENVLQQSFAKGKITEEQLQKQLVETRAKYIELSAEKAKYIQQSKLAEEQIKREAQSQARAASMVGEEMVRAFRTREAEQKASAARQAEIVKTAKEGSDNMFRTRIAFLNEEQKSVEANRKAWKEYYTTQGLLEGSTKRSKVSGEQPMDSAMRLFGKDQEKKAKDITKANLYVVSSMERVDATLSELNREHQTGSVLSERHALSVTKFANNLKMAGVSGTQAATQLEQYRNKIQQIEAIENRRAQNRLANALAPQISDVAVSVAGGMPLHLIAMQQGLQIRDLIGQSGVAAGQLQKTFQQAGKNMVTSIAGTISALGQLTYGTMVEAGKGAVKFAGSSDLASDKLDKWATSSVVARAGLAGLGLSIGGVVLGAGALAVEYIRLIGVNNDLTRAVTLNRTSFGGSTQEMYAYRDALVSTGSTMIDASKLIMEISKSSNLGAKDILLVGESAREMERWANVSIAETVKHFDKLAESPSKALTELARKTGMVTPQMIQLVKEMEKQGRTAEASALAVKIGADVHNQSIERIKNDVHSLTSTYNTFFEWFDKKWGEFSKAIGGGSKVEKLREEIEQLENIYKNTTFLTKGQANDFRATIEQKREQLRQERVIAENRAVAESANAAYARQEEQRSKDKERYTTDEKQKQKELADLERARRLGNIDADTYRENRNKILEKYSKKEITDLKEKLRIEELIDDAYIKQAGKIRNLTELEKRMMDLRNDPEFEKNYSREQRAAYLNQMAGLNSSLIDEQATKDQLSFVDKLNDSYRQAVGIKDQMLDIEVEWLRISSDPKFLSLEQSKRDEITKTKDALVEQVHALKEVQKQIEFQKELRGIQNQSSEISFEQSWFGVDSSNEALKQARANFNEKRKLAEEEILFSEKLKDIQRTSSEESFIADLARAKELYAAKISLIQQQADAERRVATEAEIRAQNYENIFKSAFENMADVFVKFAETGKWSMKDLTKSVLADILRMEMRLQALSLWKAAGGGSKDGLVGSIASLVSNFTSSGASAQTSSVMRDYGSGSPTVDHSRVSTKSSSGSNVQVVIHNNTGAPVQQKETVDSRGQRRLDITVGEMTASEMQRSGSMVQKSVGRTFGLTPQIIQR